MLGQISRFARHASRLASRFASGFAARQALILVLFLLIASCGGGGCSSGCAGCGSKPLPGGFPKAQVVPNAAAVRLTRPGLDFIGTNLPAVVTKLMGAGGSVLHFPVPKSDQTFKVPPIGPTIDIHICPTGPDATSSPPKCIADINIGKANLHLDAITPHSLKVSGTIPVRLQDLTMNASLLGDFDVGLGAGSCVNGAPQFDYKDIPVDVELPLVTETVPPRDGYTKIDTKNAIINVNITKDDVAVCKSCGIAQFICDFVFDTVKNLVFNTLVGGVTSQIKSALENQLCTKPIPTQTPPCPTGAKPDNADLTKATKCVYDSDPATCMPMMLGTDGRMDLSSALRSISPGTSGGLDFMLAAGGDMDPAPGLLAWPPPPDGGVPPIGTPNGVSLGMQGGTAPQPQSSCVPLAENPVPQGILIPDELKKDKQTPWPTTDPTGPHLGIALAGRFLNYSFTSVYNSGLLCLGVTTEQFQQLNSGYLSLIVGSIKKLTFENKPASAAITTRPQAAPKIKVGGGTNIKTDPLLTIQLNKFAIDFYIWSVDRFVRAFTFTADVTVPVNLQTAKDPNKNPNGGLLPVIGDLGIANPVVSNSDLLLDDPKTMAGGLAGLLSGIIGQFVGAGLKPIDLSNSLASVGLKLTIPDGGIRKLTKGTDDYLAIFANLALATGPAKLEAETSARIVSQTVHPEAMTLATADRAKFPTLHAVFSSPQDDGARAVEYSWWIDEGTRSGWSREKDVTIDSDYLLLQGKHVLYVSARLVDDADSEDSSPVALPFIIDTLAPNVRVSSGSDASRVEVKAWDLVSSDSALTARYRVTGADRRLGAWSEWASLDQIADIHVGKAVSVDVEVKDEAENVGTVSQALIRGRPDPTLLTGSGCGCSTPGTAAGDTAFAASLAVLAGLVAFGLRRRGAAARSPLRRGRGAALGLGSICLVAAASQGCACGSNDGTSSTGCGDGCNQPCGTANAKGLIGAYTSVAKAKDGTIWVAGYNDADVLGGNAWGDLVVGKYDSGQQLVAWTTVDGLPPARDRSTNSCPPNDPTGWRGGETDSGDDVGLWTNIQLGPNDLPMVSYYDATHMALKFASYDGKAWTSHTVKGAPKSDNGRYAKMVVASGNPVIAFLGIEKGNAGKVRSKVTIARGKTPVPAGPGDWTLEDAAVDENGPCRSLYCDSGQFCIKETGLCQPTVTGCTPTPCGGGGVGAAPQACVTIASKATCGTVIDEKYVEAYPAAFGDYISLANGPQGLGLVLYDRIHGNLIGVSNAGGKWTAMILDGETGSRTTTPPTAVDTGDVGVAASLFITPNGDWHVSYVNGFTEALQYMLVTGGKTAQTPEIVDDGLGVNGQSFGDGRHVVGDDSNVHVDANGVVTIGYQDATLGTLHVANGSLATGGVHKWTVKAVAQPNKFAGFFPQAVPGTPQFANWWRQTDHAAGNMTGDVSFVTP